MRQMTDKEMTKQWREEEKITEENETDLNGAARFYIYRIILYE